MNFHTLSYKRSLDGDGFCGSHDCDGRHYNITVICATCGWTKTVLNDDAAELRLLRIEHSMEAAIDELWELLRNE